MRTLKIVEKLKVSEWRGKSNFTFLWSVLITGKQRFTTSCVEIHLTASFDPIKKSTAPLTQSVWKPVCLSFQQFAFYWKAFHLGTGNERKTQVCLASVEMQRKRELCFFFANFAHREVTRARCTCSFLSREGSGREMHFWCGPERDWLWSRAHLGIGRFSRGGRKKEEKEKMRVMKRKKGRCGGEREEEEHKEEKEGKERGGGRQRRWEWNEGKEKGGEGECDNKCGNQPFSRVPRRLWPQSTCYWSFNYSKARRLSFYSFSILIPLFLDSRSLFSILVLDCHCISLVDARPFSNPVFSWLSFFFYLRFLSLSLLPLSSLLCSLFSFPILSSRLFSCLCQKVKLTESAGKPENLPPHPLVSSLSFPPSFLSLHAPLFYAARTAWVFVFSLQVNKQIFKKKLCQSRLCVFSKPSEQAKTKRLEKKRHGVAHSWSKWGESLPNQISASQDPFISHEVSFWPQKCLVNFFERTWMLAEAMSSLKSFFQTSLSANLCQQSASRPFILFAVIINSSNIIPLCWVKTGFIVSNDQAPLPTLHEATLWLRVHLLFLHRNPFIFINILLINKKVRTWASSNTAPWFVLKGHTSRQQACWNLLLQSAPSETVRN